MTSGPLYDHHFHHCYYSTIENCLDECSEYPTRAKNCVDANDREQELRETGSFEIVIFNAENSSYEEISTNPLSCHNVRVCSTICLFSPSLDNFFCAHEVNPMKDSGDEDFSVIDSQNPPTEGECPEGE